MDLLMDCYVSSRTVLGFSFDVSISFDGLLR